MTNQPPQPWSNEPPRPDQPYRPAQPHQPEEAYRAQEPYRAQESYRAGGQQPSEIQRRPPRPPSRGLVDPQDARAALEARRELGPDMEQALVDSFVARVEHALVQRGAAEVSERGGRLEAQKADSRNQMMLGIGSLIFAIPLTAVAGGQAGVLGMVITWVAIILVNLAYALRKGQRG